MRKLLLALGVLFLGVKVHAGPIAWNDIPNSSYTDVGSGGNIMFSSCPTQFVGVTIASPSANGFIAFYRSTTSIWTPDLSTQTIIGTDYNPFNQSTIFVPLFDMRNTSYTHINKVGVAKVTYWFKCTKENSSAANTGLCPGLGYSGQGK